MLIYRVIVLTMILLLGIDSQSYAMGDSGVINNGSLVGRPAADFTLDTIKSGQLNMTKYRDGKKAIIFFWAMWCPHCRVELKHLNNQQSEIAAKGIKIILVNLGEDKAMVSEYIASHRYSLDVFVDENQTLEEAYQIIGVPTLVFVDENGVVKHVDHALSDDYEQSFRSQ